MKRMMLGVAAATMLALVTVGCETQEETDEAALVRVTKLHLDPVDQYELHAWWSNGTQMLHLREDFSYEVYERPNRYDPPMQRGRWTQHSYAALYVEPYDRLKHERTRITIDRENDHLVLMWPKLDTFEPIDHPPLVREDQLLGSWSSDLGTLVIGSDRSYTFHASQPSAGNGAILVGHTGQWYLEDDRLVLTPAPQSMRPWLMRIADDNASLTRATTEDVFTRTPNPLAAPMNTP
jgi:hypothetical protein